MGIKQMSLVMWFATVIWFPCFQNPFPKTHFLSTQFQHHNNTIFLIILSESHTNTDTYTQAGLEKIKAEKTFQTLFLFRWF